MNLVAYGVSDAGLKREHNEDAYLVDVERGLFAVADGLGGLPRGELASQLAIEALHEAEDERFEGDEEGIGKLFNDISYHVKWEGIKISGITGIGTTLTLARISQGRLRVIHVGDCVAYLVHDGRSIRLTRDQTIAEQMKASGEMDVPGYLTHVLTQCLGQDEAILPDLHDVEFGPGSRILLCSDGITKVVPDDEIQSLLSVAGGPQEICDTLIAAANNRGGPDNSTAVAVFT